MRITSSWDRSVPAGRAIIVVNPAMADVETRAMQQVEPEQNGCIPPRPNACSGGLHVLAAATIVAGAQADSLLTEKSNWIRYGASFSALPGAVFTTLART